METLPLQPDERERMLIDALSCTRDFIYTFDREGRFLFVNQALLSLWGISMEEAVGRNFYDLKYPDDLAARLQRQVKEVVEKKTSVADETAYTSPAGVEGYYEYIFSPVLEDDGTVRAVVGTTREITERKAVDERLREQAALLDLARDAIIVAGIDSQIQFWNRGAQSVYGWTSAEAIGKRVSKLLHTDSTKHDLALQCLIDAGEWSGELRQIRKDGRQVIADSRWTLLSDQDGNPKSILIINSDITEHKKMEAQFLRAQRMESIGTLAGGVAHDLNNILAPILLSVPLLRESLPAEKRETILSDIEASAQRGTNIVNQVLTFARGAEGERLLVQPAHLINEMAHIAKEAFPKSIQVTLTYPEAPWSVEADPGQLQQVLMNLCVNARDAMPDGGDLDISLENALVDDAYAATMPGAKAGPHVVIQVSDTGRGIPRHIIDKIFDPFFTTKDVGKGTGLGLSTSIGIVKSHGGYICADSEPGVGATFRVYLPAITGLSANVAGEETDIIPRGNGEWLLLVDDERTIRNMAAAILENHGYQVAVAADGIEAFTIFAEQMDKIACVLTDLMMPLMDGIALIRTLRNMKPGVAVIASTGQRDDKRVRELNALGVPVCLNKPYNRKNLLIAVHDALARAKDSRRGLEVRMPLLPVAP